MALVQAANQNCRTIESPEHHDIRWSERDIKHEGMWHKQKLFM